MYVVAAAALLLLAEEMFGITALIIEALHRDPTLTGRTVLWQMLLKHAGNPIIGTGFDSFWMGDRLLAIGQGYWWQPNEAHNGIFRWGIFFGRMDHCSILEEPRRIFEEL